MAYYFFNLSQNSIFSLTLAMGMCLAIVAAYILYNYFFRPLTLATLRECMRTHPRSTLYKLQDPERVRALFDETTSKKAQTALLKLIALYLMHTPCFKVLGYKNWRVQCSSLNPAQYFTELTKPRPFKYLTYGVIILAALSALFQCFYLVYNSIYFPAETDASHFTLIMHRPFEAFLIFLFIKINRRRKLAIVIQRLSTFLFNHRSIIDKPLYEQLAKFVDDVIEIDHVKVLSKKTKIAAKAERVIAFFFLLRAGTKDYNLPERINLAHIVTDWYERRRRNK